MDNELTLLIGKDEKILYAGKPDKKCFIFESIFNPLLPFAIVWGLFDSFFIGASFSSDQSDKIAFFLVIYLRNSLLCSAKLTFTYRVSFGTHKVFLENV